VEEDEKCDTAADAENPNPSAAAVGKKKKKNKKKKKKGSENAVANAEQVTDFFCGSYFFLFHLKTESFAEGLDGQCCVYTRKWSPSQEPTPVETHCGCCVIFIYHSEPW